MWKTKRGKTRFIVICVVYYGFELKIRATLECLTHAARDHCRGIKSATSPSAFCSAFKSQYRAQWCPAQHGTARMLISSSNADSKQTPKREVTESFLGRLPAGYSFLALSEICNSNPRGEAKCSEHIVSAQMWTCRWTRSHRRSLGKDNTALSAPPEKYRESNQGVRGHTGSLRRPHRHGQSAKGNSCQRSSHLHYFRERSRRVLDLLQQQTPSVR